MSSKVAESDWNQNTQELRAETQGAVTFYHSLSTPGFWFGAGELEALIQSRAQLELPEPKEELTLESEFAKGPNGCLRCGEDARLFEMRSYIDSEVRMKACHVCHGRWIGNHSLRLLIHQSRYQGLRGAFQRLIDQFHQRPATR